MCLYSTPIKNRRYTKTKKNGGLVPPLIDRRIEYIPATCGNCIECRKEKARDWMVRLQEDIKKNTTGKMVTLTFSNESITKLINEHSIKRTNKLNGKIETIKIKDLIGYDKDNQIATKAVRLFVERWRKEYKTSIRHWLVTELGHKGTENIHLHGIIWLPTLDNWEEQLNTIEKKWEYGFIFKGYKRFGKLINYVNNKTVNYCVKYVSKIDQRHKEYKSIILSSPKIGANYTESFNIRENKYNGKNTQETYRTSTGHKIKLPKYYRNKIYTDVEKERLWIDKLDKEEKWVRGERVSIKNGEKEYNNLLNWHRIKNHELGYGGRPNENRKEYEEQIRETLINKRIINARRKAV